MLGVRFDSFHGTSLLLGIDGCSVIRHNTNSWGSCFVWKKKSTLFLTSAILQTKNLYMSVVARVKYRVYIYVMQTE